jgi:hypothetical protein
LGWCSISGSKLEWSSWCSQDGEVQVVVLWSRSSTMVTAQLLHIALAWCQRHAGISTPILEFPATTLPHLETYFFPGLRTYLTSTKSALILESSHVKPLQRTVEFHLIDRVLQSNKFTSKKSDKSTTAVSPSKYTPSLT